MKQRRGIRSPRKVIIRAGIFLLLGAIVNIAVAWGFATILISPTLSGTALLNEDAPENEWRLFSLRRIGAERLILWETVLPAEWSQRTSETQKSPTLIDRLPGWCTIGSVDRMRDAALALPFLVQEASGWPLPCLRSTGSIVHSSDRRTGVFISDGIVIDGFAELGAGLSILRTPYGLDPLLEKAYLPLLPAWPGFAINTLFYAAILWLLFALPGALRRMWRIKRGLCPACAYPIGTSELCTECGKPVRASTT